VFSSAQVLEPVALAVLAANEKSDTENPRRDVPRHASRRFLQHDSAALAANAGYLEELRRRKPAPPGFRVADVDDERGLPGAWMRRCDPCWAG
jgi:hypothetical protein